MRAIAEAYMAEHPEVKIETQVTPWSEYWTKLEAAAQGGQLPDVFWMHSNQFMKYASAGMLLNLTDMNYDYSPYPSGITALYNFDGAQLAIPKDYDTIALAYNKEIFDAAGLSGRYLDVGDAARDGEEANRQGKEYLWLRRAERYAVRLSQLHLSKRRLCL